MKNKLLLICVSSLVLFGCNSENISNQTGNNIVPDSVVDTIPEVRNIRVDGKINEGEVLKVHYQFIDPEDLESPSGSEVQWYADDNVIESGTSLQLTKEMASRSLRVSVKPIAASGKEKNSALRVLAYVGSFNASYPVNEDQPPLVTDIKVIGSFVEGQVLDVQYTFIDTDKDVEGRTNTTWLLDDIEVSNNANYLIPFGTSGKKLSVVIKPISMTGVNAEKGMPVKHNVGTIQKVIVDNPPVVSNVSVTGQIIEGAAVFASYSFNDIDQDNEHGTLIEWMIDGKVYSREQSFVIPSGSLSKFLNVRIVPKSLSGNNNEGQAYVHNAGKIGLGGATTPGVGELAPLVNNIHVVGDLVELSQVYAAYNYYDHGGNEEGNTEIEWFLDNSSVGMGNSFNIPSKSVGKKLTVSITPVTQGSGNESNGLTYWFTGGVINDAVKVPTVVDKIAYVTGLKVSGQLSPLKTVYAVYNFHDANGESEGDSRIEWFLNGVSIESSVSKQFVMPANATDQILSVKITPMSDVNGNQISGHELLMYAGVVKAETSVNHPPKALTTSLSTLSNTENEHQLYSFDQDGDSVSYDIPSEPSFGKIRLLDDEIGTISYTPNPGYVGQDSFIYSVNDGRITAASEVKLNVLDSIVSENTAPSLQTRKITVLEATTATYQLIGYDKDGDVLTFQIDNQPINGHINIDDSRTGLVTYISNNGFTGKDEFTYSVSDGKNPKSILAVTVHVTDITSINKPPVGKLSNFKAHKNSTTEGVIIAHDPNGDKLDYVAVSHASNGTFIITDRKTGLFEYTPDLNFTGSDMVSYSVSDGEYSDTKNLVIVTSELTSVNKPPRAFTNALNALSNSTSNFQLSAIDPEGSNLQFSITSTTTSGVLTMANSGLGVISYTPDSNYKGNDSFEYLVSDGELDVLETVIINVNSTAAPNEAPRAFELALFGLVDKTLTGTLKGYDKDGDELTYSILHQPEFGTATVVGTHSGEFSYKPPRGFVGKVNFNYSVDDGHQVSIGKVTLEVSNLTSIKEPPLIAKTMFNVVDKDEDFYMHVPVFDRNTGERLTYSIDDSETVGGIELVSHDNSDLIYMPDYYSSSVDKFDLIVSDGVFETRRTITLNIQNQAPIPVTVSAEVFRNTKLNSIFLLAIDRDLWESPSFGIVELPKNGTVYQENGNSEFVYTPNKNFIGKDRMKYSVTDDYETIEQELVINVLNKPPVAYDSKVTAKYLTSIKFYLRGSDEIQNTKLTYAMEGAPSAGTAAINAETGEVTYEPLYDGNDILRFKVSDGEVESKEGSINIAIEIPFVDVKCSINVCYGIKKDSSLWVAGSNRNNQLGISGYRLTNKWLDTGFTNVASIYPNVTYGYFITKTGDLYETGELSTGNRSEWTPTAITDAVDMSGIMKGAYLIRGAAHDLWVLGGNSDGDLGLGHNNPVSTWTKTTLSNVSKIHVGSPGSAYAIVAGELYVTGANYRNELGLGHNKDVNLWTSTGLLNVDDVKGLSEAALALIGGELYRTGSSSYTGEDIDGSKSNNVKWASTGYKNITLIDAMDKTSFRVSSTPSGIQEMNCTGEDDKGQCGQGVGHLYHDKWVKTEIPGESSTIVGVSLGVRNVYVKTGNEESYLIGDNTDSKLGLGRGLSINTVDWVKMVLSD
ncbi:tandem-95 repeat protein (plasmid) [Aliivibrio salmonicida]|uniref:Ig-like domain-containing protein n=1 Tax=Aliivibrio salmonicida TaxID=40269 RepID=UPI000F71A36B|nr:Ig-like domain-containing protein [Aliivibrio salmonicida]AZL83470.1 tandem-95 repeat protein [Aliivibrio salmonicida]